MSLCRCLPAALLLVLVALPPGVRGQSSPDDAKLTAERDALRREVERLKELDRQLKTDMHKMQKEMNQILREKETTIRELQAHLADLEGGSKKTDSKKTDGKGERGRDQEEVQKMLRELLRAAEQLRNQQKKAAGEQPDGQRQSLEEARDALLSSIREMRRAVQEAREGIHEISLALAREGTPTKKKFALRNVEIEIDLAGRAAVEAAHQRAEAERRRAEEEHARAVRAEAMGNALRAEVEQLKARMEAQQRQYQDAQLQQQRMLEQLRAQVEQSHAELRRLRDELTAERQNTAKALQALREAEELLRRSPPSPERKPSPALEKEPINLIPAQIEAKVTAVTEDGKTVRLSVGKSLGAQVGQVLEVYQLKPERRYLGRLRVIEAIANNSVGELLPGAGGRLPQVQVGDLATNVRQAPAPRQKDDLPPGGGEV